MAGAFPVVPLHAVVSDQGRAGRVINAIQVGGSASIKPPAWGTKAKRKNMQAQSGKCGGVEGPGPLGAVGSWQDNSKHKTQEV